MQHTNSLVRLACATNTVSQNKSYEGKNFYLGYMFPIFVLCDSASGEMIYAIPHQKLKGFQGAFRGGSYGLHLKPFFQGNVHLHLRESSLHIKKALFLPAATASRRSSNGSCRCCCCCCSWFQDFYSCRGKGGKVLGKGVYELKGSNPEESFIREVSTYVWKVLATCQDFLWGWIPESQGIQPRRKFYTRSQHLCLTGLGKVSRLSSGRDPWISRDPTPKKVLYAKSAPMSDGSWQGVKTFFGVGSRNLKGSNPEESFIREASTYVWWVLARCQDFLRGWIPESQGIQPRRKFYTRSQHLWQTGLGKVSRLSSGLDLPLKSWWNNRRRSMSIICSCFLGNRKLWRQAKWG